MSYISFSNEELTEKISESAEVLKDNPVFRYYYDYIKHDNRKMMDLYKTLSGFPSLQMIKETYPGTIDIEDILLYAYLLPRTSADLTDEQCLTWYKKKKKNAKEYFSRSFIKKDTQETMVASINLTQYVEREWLNLRMVFSSKEDAVTKILYSIDSKWAVNTDDIYGEYLINYPLINLLSVAKCRRFFLNDVGTILYHHMLQQKTISDTLIIPRDVLLQQFIGMTQKKILADVNYDTDSGKLLLKSDKYNTIFDSIDIYANIGSIDGLSEQERQQKVSSFISQVTNEKRLYPNITAYDTAVFINIQSLFANLPKGEYLEMELGEIYKKVNSSTSSPDTQIINRKSGIIDVLEAIHKWSTYSFLINGENGSGQLHFMSYLAGELADSENFYRAVIRSDSDTPGISDQVSRRTGYEISFRTPFDRRKYEAMTYHDLEHMPIKIELSQLFRDNMERNRMSAAFRNVYNKLSSHNSRMIYAYIDQCHVQRKKDIIGISLKDFQKAFVIEMRPVRFLTIVDNVMNELVRFGAINSYCYTEKEHLYTISFSNEHAIQPV